MMKTTARLFAAAAIAALSLGAARDARAGVYTFSFAGFDTGSGELFTDSTLVGGAFTITDISGTIGGKTITGLLAPDTFPKAARNDPNDNLLFVAKPYLDLNGVSFTAGAGDKKYNIFFNAGYNEFTAADGVQALTNLKLASVPEPVGMTLVGAGLIGLGLARHRRG